MAQSHHHQEGVKDKVAAIREIVPSRSNHEITLVLQYYDYDLTRATQAFVEGNTYCNVTMVTASD